STVSTPIPASRRRSVSRLSSSPSVDSELKPVAMMVMPVSGGLDCFYVSMQRPGAGAAYGADLAKGQVRVAGEAAWADADPALVVAVRRISLVARHGRLPLRPASDPAPDAFGIIAIALAELLGEDFFLP